jgi:hypothetical protein
MHHGISRKEEKGEGEAREEAKEEREYFVQELDIVRATREAIKILNAGKTTLERDVAGRAHLRAYVASTYATIRKNFYDYTNDDEPCLPWIDTSAPNWSKDPEATPPPPGAFAAGWKDIAEAPPPCYARKPTVSVNFEGTIAVVSSVAVEEKNSRSVTPNIKGDKSGDESGSIQGTASTARQSEDHGAVEETGCP